MSSSDKKRPQNRDQLRPITPPKGVQQQIAAPIGESWDGEDTGNSPTPTKAHDDSTPVGLPALEAEADERMRARVKTIKQVAETTATSVDTLRTEYKRDIARVERKVDDMRTEHKADTLRIEGKVDGHGGHLLAIVGTVGELKGSVEQLIRRSEDDAERGRIEFDAHIAVDKHAKVTEIDVNKQRAITAMELAKAAEVAAIDDGAKKIAWWRDLKLKVIGGVVSLVTSGAVAGYLITRAGC